MAHAHGLSMRVDSVVKQGTKFTIIFPYKDDGIYGVDGMMPLNHPGDKMRYLYDVKLWDRIETAVEFLILWL